MFPPEVITFSVTFILRTIADKWIQSGEDRRAEKAMDRDMLKLELEAQHHIRGKMSDKIFSITASILAIIAFTCIIGLRIVGPMFTDTPVYFAFTETSGGFLWLLNPTTKVQYMELPGITFLPSDSHLIAAIAGAFFGKVRK
jgi:hypothetical protein